MGTITIPSSIWTEAKHLAIKALKDRARAQGIRPISAIPYSKWAELAVRLIQQDFSFIYQAQSVSPVKPNITFGLEWTTKQIAVTSKPAHRQR